MTVSIRRALRGTILIFVLMAAKPALAVRVYGAEPDAPDSRAAQLTEQCESILSNLEKSSGIQITDPDVRKRLIEEIKQNPERTLLHLMATKSAMGSVASPSLDGVIKEVLERMNTQAQDSREHNERMRETYEKDRCESGGKPKGRMIYL